MNSIIGPALIGKNPTEQTKLDNFMVQQLDRTVNEWGWCKQKRYDPDPAAKAAAATVLASKLGVDSGLKVYMGDDTKFNPPTRMSSDVEHLQSSGLRKCKQSVSRSSSAESSLLHQLEEEIMQYAGPEGPEMSKHNQLIVEHQNPTSLDTQDGGWIARIAALLVGEDPT